ncbi:hypothetical protein PM082_011914 [Marasmius tenuissimus]|nr:hypothetical protein PM082_011914 [Marasmius tenuissimus]
MPRYVKTVSVEYGYMSGSSTDHHDINKGMGGECSYIKPEYTDKRSEAAFGFEVEVTKIEDFHAADLSKGDRMTYFRYLHAFYTYGGLPAITKVWISTVKDTTEGDGRTGDINRNRGGESLYLCWEYEKEDTQTYSIVLGLIFPAPFTLFHLLSEKVVTADHPFYTDDCRDDPDVLEGHEATVRLGDIVFSQSNVGQLIGGSWEDETVWQTIQNMLRIRSIQDRRAYIAARYDQLRVVPIRRRTDASPDDATSRLMLSLDNRRLLLLRATLPVDERITIWIATSNECERELKKWTSRDEGYTIKVRGRRVETPPHVVL